MLYNSKRWLVSRDLRKTSGLPCGSWVLSFIFSLKARKRQHKLEDLGFSSGFQAHKKYYFTCWRIETHRNLCTWIMTFTTYLDEIKQFIIYSGPRWVLHGVPCWLNLFGWWGLISANAPWLGTCTWFNVHKSWEINSRWQEWIGCVHW